MSSSLLSCSNHREKIVEEFMNTTLVVDFDKMLYIGTDSTWKDKAQFIHVLWLDSANCSSCISNKTVLWNDFEKKAQKICPGYKFCTVISGDKSKKKMIEKIQYYSVSSIPIYIDTADVFIKYNPIIKKSQYFNCFLMDRCGKIKIIGNPTINAKIEPLIFDFLRKQKSEINTN